MPNINLISKELFFRNPNFFIGEIESYEIDGTIKINIIGETDSSIRALYSIPITEAPPGFNSGSMSLITNKSLVYGIFLDEQNTTPLIIGYIPQIDYDDERFYNRRIENNIDTNKFIYELNKIIDSEKILNNPTIKDVTYLDYIRNFERKNVKFYINPPDIKNITEDFVNNIYKYQILYYKNINQIKNEVDSFISSITLLIEDYLKSNILKYINSIKFYAKDEINKIVNREIYGNSEIVLNISNILYEFLDCIIGFIINKIISSILSKILDFLKKCFDDIKKIINKIFDFINNIISKVFDILKKIINNIIKILSPKELEITLKCNNEGGDILINLNLNLDKSNYKTII
ncbi:MAG: hypothetical protein QXW48_01395 [Thermoplasmata archaeon]